MNGQCAPQQSVPSDRFAGWLLIWCFGIEILRVLLSQFGLITPELNGSVELLGYAAFGALLCILAWQGAYYGRIRRVERRWRLQIAAVLALTGFGLWGVILLSKNLDEAVQRFANAEGPIAHEDLMRLLAGNDVDITRKINLSLSIASTAYIQKGELRPVLDSRGNWVQFRPSTDDVEHRRLVLKLKKGSIRPTRQEIIGGLAFAACVLFACLGYLRATQFSNRAPNASL